MTYTRQLLYETLRSRDSATFTGAYQTLGSALSNAASLVKIVNNSTVLVTVSVDGTNDHDILPASSFTLYDKTSNSPSQVGAVFAEKGRQYYVKGSAGSGSVYLVVQYVRET